MCHPNTRSSYPDTNTSYLNSRAPTPTPVPPTSTPVPPTPTSVPPTSTPVPPTPTPVPPTSTPVPPTPTPVPPTSTPVPPTPTPVPPTPTLPITVKLIVDDIAAEVGKVTRVIEGDPNRIIIAFEETHNSPAGQIEIAIMLNRLYERYDLRYIGLEGHFATDGNLDAAWFDPSFVAGQPIREREDVIVQLLEDGEISSSETMALIYADVSVTGVEDASEYNYEPPDEAWSAHTWHLFQIAALGMTQSEITKFNELVGDEKIMDAIEFAINTDEWTSEKYTLIQDETIIISAEEWLQIIDDIAAKATEVGAGVSADDKASLQALRRFFEVASNRSRTMVDYTLDLLQQSPGAPVAMIIGAAHTDLVAQLFANEGMSFAVIRGNSLEENREEGDLHYQAYGRKSDSQSVDSVGTLGALLDGRKKPRPVIGEIWLQSKANIYLLVDLLARAAADGEMPPFTDALSDLPPLEGVTLNKDSIQMEGGDVIFSVEALDQNGNWVTIWVRARASRERAAKLLEQRLLEGYDRVQSKEEPSEEPEPETSPAVLVPVSSETVAKFSASEAEIETSSLG
jgi:hypothetical protein